MEVDLFDVGRDLGQGGVRRLAEMVGLAGVAVVGAGHRLGVQRAVVGGQKVQGVDQGGRDIGRQACRRSLGRGRGQGAARKLMTLLTQAFQDGHGATSLGERPGQRLEACSLGQSAVGRDGQIAVDGVQRLGDCRHGIAEDGLVRIALRDPRRDGRVGREQRLPDPGVRRRHPGQGLATDAAQGEGRRLQGLGPIDPDRKLPQLGAGGAVGFQARRGDDRARQPGPVGGAAVGKERPDDLVREAGHGSVLTPRTRRSSRASGRA